MENPVSDVRKVAKKWIFDFKKGNLKVTPKRYVRFLISLAHSLKFDEFYRMTKEKLKPRL